MSSSKWVYEAPELSKYSGHHVCAEHLPPSFGHRSGSMWKCNCGIVWRLESEATTLRWVDTHPWRSAIGLDGALWYQPGWWARRHITDLT